MRLNPSSKGVESKLYFIIFFLFSSFLALIVYNFALDALVEEELSYSKDIGIFRMHLDVSGPELKDE
jgi:hypothetical protein